MDNNENNLGKGFSLCVRISLFANNVSFYFKQFDILEEDYNHLQFSTIRKWLCILCIDYYDTSS